MPTVAEPIAPVTRLFEPPGGEPMRVVLVFAGDEHVIEPKTGKKAKLDATNAPVIEFYRPQLEKMGKETFVCGYELDGLRRVVDNLSLNASIIPGVDGRSLTQIMAWAQNSRLEIEQNEKRNLQPRS